MRVRVLVTMIEAMEGVEAAGKGVPSHTGEVVEGHDHENKVISVTQKGLDLNDDYRRDTRQTDIPTIGRPPSESSPRCLP